MEERKDIEKEDTKKTEIKNEDHKKAEDESIEEEEYDGHCEHCEEHGKRMDGHEDRIGMLEHHMRKMHDDFDRLLTKKPEHEEKKESDRSLERMYK